MNQERKQPPWDQPEAVQPTVLKFYNSMTRSKTAFQPRQGRQVTWYNCGPTVYDQTHMGHARLYVTVDIIRRVLQQYFKYDLLFVMNITDIDDKIIIRARHNHLFELYVKRVTAGEISITDMVLQVTQALGLFLKQHFNTSSLTLSDWDTSLAATLKEQAQDKPKLMMHWKAADQTVKALAELPAPGKEAEWLARVKDTLVLWLDSKEGDTVTDPKVFRKLAEHWETKFLEDMEALNVLPCDILTRVSEYVPEIVNFVEKIIENGYGYESGGSVYFDTMRFNASKEHFYAKLEPWSAMNLDLIAEGEGALQTNDEKRHPSDFALWKKSKRGEPAWDSPWGLGRPGWHIECSVMAGEVIGDHVDIHSGGIDLAFPHHDNEMAQSEAYFGCKQWVDYFLHVGHLHIEGQKMSKSLKNMISVQEALQLYSARQLRITFLLHQWDSGMDFKQSSMIEAMAWETAFLNFFTNTKALILELRTSRRNEEGSHQFNQPEKDLMKALKETKKAVHAALCDSINTPVVMQELIEFVTKANIYLSKGRQAVNVTVLEYVSSYLTEMMNVLGLSNRSSTMADLGFGSSQGKGQQADVESLVMPYLKSLSKFRDTVRELARSKQDHKEFLKLCDHLRDVELPELGVQLDDQDDGEALVKLVGKEQVTLLREEKRKREEEKQARKAAQLAEQERKKQENLMKGKMAPNVMFQQGEYENLFSAFDEEGIPTHDAAGEEVAKSRKKKLQKLWETQKKLHAEYLASLTAQ